MRAYIVFPEGFDSENPSVKDIEDAQIRYTDKEPVNVFFLEFSSVREAEVWKMVESNKVSNKHALKSLIENKTTKFL